MRLGKIKILFTIIFTFIFLSLTANEKISTVPLINLENLEPSYEAEDTSPDKVNNLTNKSLLKEKISEYCLSDILNSINNLLSNSS